MFSFPSTFSIFKSCLTKFIEPATKLISQFSHHESGNRSWHMISGKNQTWLLRSFPDPYWRSCRRDSVEKSAAPKRNNSNPPESWSACTDFPVKSFKIHWFYSGVRGHKSCGRGQTQFKMSAHADGVIWVHGLEQMRNDFWWDFHFLFIRFGIRENLIILLKSGFSFSTTIPLSISMKRGNGNRAFQIIDCLDIERLVSHKATRHGYKGFWNHVRDR